MKYMNPTEVKLYYNPSMYNPCRPFIFMSVFSNEILDNFSSINDTPIKFFAFLIYIA